jgi:hypothetical protein
VFRAAEPVEVAMKQRLSTADVVGEVACLRARIIGMRVSNVYDINPKVCSAWRRTFILESIVGAI